MTKNDSRKGTVRKGRVSMSDRLRAAYDYFEAEGWDVATISTSEIVAKAKSLIRGKEAQALRDAFNPTPAQVSIVKREYTGGSPTGGRGRPSHESIGMAVEEAA